MVFCSAQLTHNADIWSAPKMLLLRITAQGGQKKKKPKRVPAVMLHNTYLKACNKLLLKSFSQNQSSKHIFSNQILAPQVFSFTSLIFSYQLLPGKTPEWQKFFSH